MKRLCFALLAGIVFSSNAGTVQAQSMVAIGYKQGLLNGLGGGYHSSSYGSYGSLPLTRPTRWSFDNYNHSRAILFRAQPRTWGFDAYSPLYRLAGHGLYYQLPAGNLPGRYNHIRYSSVPLRASTIGFADPYNSDGPTLYRADPTSAFYDAYDPNNTVVGPGLILRTPEAP